MFQELYITIKHGDKIDDLDFGPFDSFFIFLPDIICILYLPPDFFFIS